LTFVKALSPATRIIDGKPVIVVARAEISLAIPA
jgi:hypothetical protein